METQERTGGGRGGRGILVATLVALPLVCGALVYGYFELSGRSFSDFFGDSPVPESELDRELADSRALLDRGGSTDEVLSLLERHASVAATDAEGGKVRLNAGITYLSGGMLEKGAEILREVSLDERYLPDTRAAAIERLVQFYGSLADKDFGLTHVFVGEVWGGFLDDGATSREALSVASRRALEWASDLAGNYLVEFRIADWYAYALATAKDSDRAQYVGEVKRRLTRGNSHFASAISAFRASAAGAPTKSQIAAGYLLRAYAVAHLFRSGDREIPASVAEGDFNASISGNDNVAGTFFARFHYASFLAALDAKAHEPRIRELLAPLYDARYASAGIFNYLQAQLTDPYYAEGRIAEDIRALAQIDERLGEKLADLGASL